MEKEFGRLSSQQVIDFYRAACTNIEQLKDIAETLPEPDQKETNTVPWAAFYELPFLNIVVHLLDLMGAKAELDVGLQNGDVNEHFIKLMQVGYEPPVELNDLSDQQRVNFSAWLMCLMMNFICHASYRTDISSLLKDAREGHSDSLFKAINIDQSIVSTDTASRLISTAIIESDEEFFDKLSRAIKGNYPRKPREDYPELNFFVYLIEEAAGESIVDKKELHRLLTQDIPLYPDDLESMDSFGSFTRHLRRTKYKVKDKKT